MPTPRTSNRAFIRRTSIALALSLCSPLLMAHGLWLERDGGGYTLLQGHLHSGHAGAETLPYDPAIFRSAACLDRNGASTRNASRTYPLRLSADCAVLLLAVSSGYWTKTVWETRNAPRDQVQGAMKSWLSEESVKRIDRWLPAAAQPMGDGLELVPASDPTQLRPGDKLGVMVTENRQPKAGVAVAYQGSTRGVTGSDGRVSIRLRQAGTQIITASSETLLSDGKADVAIRTTALQFEIAP